MRTRGEALAWAALLALTVGCGGGAGGGTTNPTPTPTAASSGERLSATGLYDSGTQNVRAGNRAWTPQYPLWSDGSAKERWISLPAGTRIDTSDMDRWVFPVGTKIWKQFSFLGKRVETRLIEKVGQAAAPASWTFKTYRWLDDGSDAVLVSADGVKDAAMTSFGTTHDIPALGECLGCHSRGGDAVLGFDALQLSGDVDPLVRADGLRSAGDVTLDDLVAEGLVTNAPNRAPRIQSDSAIARWSMGFLHANCGNCHNAKGPGGVTGLLLRHESGAARETDEAVYATGVNQLTAVYHRGSYRIRGGSPDASVLLSRMSTRVVGDQMPPSASKVVDADAVERLRQWILTLPTS